MDTAAGYTGSNDRQYLSQEELLAYLSNLGIESKIRPALEKAGIGWGQYLRNTTRTIDELAEAGAIVHPQFPRFNGWESRDQRQATRTMIVMHAINNLPEGSTLVIPYEAELFSGSRLEDIKRGPVLTTRPLSETEPERQWFNEPASYLPNPEMSGEIILPRHQLRKYLSYLNITHNIVGFKFEGRVSLLNDNLRGQIAFEKLRPHYVEVKDYSGEGIESGAWRRTEEGLTALCKNVPSLTTAGKHYDIIMRNVPAYRGNRVPRQIVQDAYHIESADHFCEKKRWYGIKRWRYSAYLGRDSKASPTKIEVTKYRGVEDVYCQDEILATRFIKRYLEEEGFGWKTLDPYMTFNDDWKTFYMKLLKDVFIERWVPVKNKGKDKKEVKYVVRNYPLKVREIEMLLWKRIVYLNARQNYRR